MNIYILNMQDKQGNTFSPSIRANNYKDAVKLGRHLAKKEGCKFLSIRSKSINQFCGIYLLETLSRKKTKSTM